MIMLLIPAFVLFDVASDNRRLQLLLAAAYIAEWPPFLLAPVLGQLPGALPLLTSALEVVPIVGLFVVAWGLMRCPPGVDELSVLGKR